MGKPYEKQSEPKREAKYGFNMPKNSFNNFFFDNIDACLGSNFEMSHPFPTAFSSQQLFIFQNLSKIATPQKPNEYSYFNKHCVRKPATPQPTQGRLGADS